MNAWVNADGGVLRTGSYLSYVGPDGTMRNVANAALLTRIVGQLRRNGDNTCWTEYQARGLLGDARRSYIVGTKHNPPMRAQHKVYPDAL